MPRPTLKTAYTAGALLLAVTAIQHAAAGHWPHAAVATVLAVLLADGAVRVSEYDRVREELRHAHEDQTRADARARHAAAVTTDTEAIWSDLFTTCCLRGWETNGAAHDPATCTRTENHR